MSLTAATSGVDPQTGSYLSKEQRVAMFQSSRGRGGESSTPGQKRGGVAPQNAIVVANKMASVVQTLQTNTQETVQAVNVKVQENAQNIENLYKSVQNNRAAEVIEEKEETKDLRADRENALRAGKEKLIEGLSAAVAGIASMGRRAADAALAPVMGLWEKIKRFLLLLGAAWAVENLPSIIASVKDFVSWLGDLKSWLPKSLTGLRGVWSIADNIIRAMWRGFRRIAGTVFRIATWIGTQIYKLAKKIFTPIGRFLSKLVRRIVNHIANVLGRSLSWAGDAIQNLTKGTSGARPRGGQPQLPPGGATGGKAATEAAEEGGGGLFGMVKKFFRGAKDIGKNALNKGGELLEGGGKAIRSGLGKLQETTTGVKIQSDAVRAGWFEDAIGPLIKRFPDMKGALNAVKGLARGALKAIPLLGFAIDLALNKGVAGQPMTEAIIRAMGSSIVGGLSAAAGAKIGGGIGFAAGSVIPVLGNIAGAAIGAGLGAIIAGIAGGMGGDQLGASIFESTTGETRTENKPENNTSNLQIQATEGMDQGVLHKPGEKENVKVEVKGTDGMVASATNGNSTPDGMTEPDGSGATSSFEVVDLPPNVIESGNGGESKGDTDLPSSIEDPPFWQTTDPSADAYRNYARQEFELAY